MPSQHVSQYALLLRLHPLAEQLIVPFSPQVTVSNPPEVAKTRLQLQGELAKDGGVKVYTNALDVLSKTFKNEGIRGVQRGLGPAVRFGTFRTCHDVDISA